MYEAIQELQYLDMVVQESLRLYPPAPRYTSIASPNMIKCFRLPLDYMHFEI